MKLIGQIPSRYPPLDRNGELAEYIGVVLGDGNIGKFPRTERIIITANSNNQGFIDRYSIMTRRIFKKAPTVSKVKNKNCVRISLYQNKISSRLGIPCGNRANLKFELPRWIKRNKKNCVGFLRGLYEAEGSFCIHLPTSTYKLLFSNKNESLLSIVQEILADLGFTTNRSSYKVQVSRKDEVFKLKNLLHFRAYDTL